MRASGLCRGKGTLTLLTNAREHGTSLSVLAVKIVARPAALYPLKSVATASLQDRPGPSCPTSDSQRKLSDQQSRLSKKKQSQHQTGSGSHRVHLNILLDCIQLSSLRSAAWTPSCVHTTLLLLLRLTRHQPVAFVTGCASNCSPVASR